MLRENVGCGSDRNASLRLSRQLSFSRPHSRCSRQDRTLPKPQTLHTFIVASGHLSGVEKEASDAEDMLE